MSHDTEPGEVVRIPSWTPADPRDLEALTTLLELAAIFLTEDPSSTFTAEQLVAEARDIAGDEVKFDENDLRIVLGTAGFLERLDGDFFRLK
jgi:hypothetical protein